jgi:hypothetical protein
MTDEAILKSAKTALSGMNAIRDFCRSINLASSEVTVIKMIRESGFPAKKLGGIWESDKEAIVDWRKKFINEEIKPEIKPEVKPEVKSQPEQYGKKPQSNMKKK